VEPHVKERIVGAAVLVALGVWLIPWILDGPDDVVRESESLPEISLPAAEPITPLRTENRAPDQPAPDGIDPAFIDDGAAARNAPPAAVASAAETPPDRGGWSVQLGAFGERANADQLARRVSTFGYDAYVSEFRSNGATMYRVRVGGFASENQADAAAGSISAHSIPARVISPE
jgi:DedD protein